MRILYFDCFSEISGDMVLGALLDLGIDQESFRAELKKLNLNEYTIDIEKTVKSGIAGTDVHINTIEHNHCMCGEDSNTNNCVMKIICKTEIYNKEHIHDKNDDDDHNNRHQNTRNLFDIEVLIDSSDLNARVKIFSKEIFNEIARAEAKVYNKNIYDVRFHEVGAVDSIVYIVGSCICIDMLSIDRIYSSLLNYGSGFIECQHGTMPVPDPDVMEMLADSNIPYVLDSINTELITLTGAGIIKTMANYFGIMPKMYVEKVGYGFGKKDIGRLNALRVVVGTLFEEATLNNDVSLLETNIDDISS